MTVDKGVKGRQEGKRIYSATLDLIGREMENGEKRRAIPYATLSLHKVEHAWCWSRRCWSRLVRTESVGRDVARPQVWRPTGGKGHACTARSLWRCGATKRDERGAGAGWAPRRRLGPFGTIPTVTPEWEGAQKHRHLPNELVQFTEAAVARVARFCSLVLYCCCANIRMPRDSDGSLLLWPAPCRPSGATQSGPAALSSALAGLPESVRCHSSSSSASESVLTRPAWPQ